MDGLKIVMFVANPFGDLKIDEEIRRIKDKLERPNLERLEIVPVEATRPGDLIDELNEHRPQIVHFSGHGVSARPREGVSAGGRDLGGVVEGDAGKIILVGEDGAPKPVSEQGLVELFHQRSSLVRVVVLNACYTASQARAIARYVDCVIGTDRSIKDEAARIFAALLLNKVAKDLTDHSEEDEILDHREMAGNRYQGLNRVWISCDKVYTERGKKLVGAFVVYHVDPIRDPAILKKYPQTNDQTSG